MKIISSGQSVTVKEIQSIDRHSVSGLWLRVNVTSPWLAFPWRDEPCHIEDGWAQCPILKTQIVPGAGGLEIDVLVGAH